jgi:hypothetical protein
MKRSGFLKFSLERRTNDICIYNPKNKTTPHFLFQNQTKIDSQKKKKKKMMKIKKKKKKTNNKTKKKMLKKPTPPPPTTKTRKKNI